MKPENRYRMFCAQDDHHRQNRNDNLENDSKNYTFDLFNSRLKLIHNILADVGKRETANFVFYWITIFLYRIIYISI